MFLCIASSPGAVKIKSYLFIYFFKLNEINISKNGRVEVKKLVRHLYNLDFIVITIIMMEIFKKERSDEV